jgi:Na+/H+ antiporter NhaD and related arsenite permeases
MTVEWWSIIPFVLLLLAIAVFPLIKATEEAWDRNIVKLVVALALAIPVATWLIVAGAGVDVVHSIVEYLQFIILLLSLFVVSGGLCLTGSIRPTPRNNTLFLVAGGAVASFIGTTGAAMLLIRPLLNANKLRQKKVHTVVFTIFIVANCGGVLTPLGDPPLFLGMLRGVPFTWTFGLFPQWLFVNVLLLLTYFGLEKAAFATEKASVTETSDSSSSIGVKGGLNFLFLAVIIVSVALVPSIDLEAIGAGEAGIVQMIPWRELAMLTATLGSLFLGDKTARFEINKFTWSPILEVAALFIGIFITMIPALKFLGQVAPNLPLNQITLFIFSGGLSSVLDNAPTYATFFEMASHVPGEPSVAGVPEALLSAISLGAVFGGAITYIGNGPNFMTKSVADSAGVKMPSFGGYIVWSFSYLVPVLISMTLVFLVDGWAWKIVGVVLAVLLALRSLVTARSGSRKDDALKVSS